MSNTEQLFQENVVLVDADFLDSITYNLNQNFQQMLFRDIPLADLAEWLVCVALDGGVPKGKNTIQCIFVHSKEKLVLEQFQPGEFAHELDGTAFYDPLLGEFQMSCLSIEDIAGEDFFSQCAQILINAREVKRLILVPDIDLSEERLRPMIIEANQGKLVTLLSMVPTQDIPHTMLAFSLMHAMGIKPDEL